MPTAYIVEAVRTAGGKKNGRLSKWHPVALGAAVLDAVVRAANDMQYWLLVIVCGLRDREQSMHDPPRVCLWHSQAAPLLVT
jgi:acetyl-CoA acetyltransferase